MIADGYSLYKPLKNILGKLCLEDALYVIWAYAQNFQFATEFPPDIETPDGYSYSAYHARIRVCAPWELETLAKLVIVEAGDWSQNGQDLRRIKCFSKVLNRLKHIENSLAGIYSNQTSILVEIFRIAHRQFPWQESGFKDTFVRHYKIYSTPELSVLLKDILGITVDELYFTGFCFFALFLDKAYVDAPINTDQLKNAPLQINKFLELFCKDYKDIGALLRSEIDLNDKFAYSSFSLRAYPIIRMTPRRPGRFICPLPTLLLWQLTGALYYKLVDKIMTEKDEHKRGILYGNFGRIFGDSFQENIREMLDSAAGKWGINYLPEKEYRDGKNLKRTVDFALYDKDTLFMECKTKRIRYPSKVELLDGSLIETDLRAIAGAIVQLYKAINEYKKGKYGSEYGVCTGNIYPLLVTLENLYLFDSTFGNRVDEYVREGLRGEKLDLSCIERYPYSWCSASEFQKMLKVVSKEGIEKFFSQKLRSKEKRTWQYFTYISNDYPGYREEEFELSNDFEAIFEKYLGGRWRKREARG